MALNDNAMTSGGLEIFTRSRLCAPVAICYASIVVINHRSKRGNSASATRYGLASVPFGC